jgi:hypothetical protein
MSMVVVFFNNEAGLSDNFIVKMVINPLRRIIQEKINYMQSNHIDNIK